MQLKTSNHVILKP